LKKNKNKETLSVYLSSHVAKKESYGKAYWRRYYASLIFGAVSFVFRKTFKLFQYLSWRMSFALIILLVVFSTTISVLSAPKSVTVSLKADWERGTLTNANAEGSQDAIQLDPEGSWTERIVTPTPETIGYGSSSVMAGNYLYVTRGYAGKDFWRYDTADNSWENIADLPQPANYGADLAYLESDGDIYATFGGYSQQFYKYDVEDDEWERLDDLPDVPYSGAAIETDGTDIYFIRGNAGAEFYMYDVSDTEDHWKLLSGAPGTVTTGGGLVYGNDGYMYLVRGNGVLFHRYKLEAPNQGTWENLANIQVGVTQYTITGETKGVYWTDGTVKYLYFLRSSGTSNVLRYQINCNDGSTGTCAGEKNTWTLVTESGYGTPGLVNANFASLSYDSNDDNIYAIQGNGTQNIWKLDPDGAANQKWIGPKNVQNAAGTLQAVGTGGDLIYCNGSLQAILGGNAAAAAGHYVYNTSTNTWTNGGTSGFYQVNNDVKGTCYNNTVYFPRSGAATVFINSGGNWSNLANNFPANAGEGAGMAYNSGDSRIYALRGWAGGTAGTNDLFYQAASGGAWSNAADISISDGGTTINYYPTTGARIVSNGTNLFVAVGGGETAFLRYNTGSNNWTKMASTPFSQYYGFDMTYDSSNQKIYALAGYYKDETWEYDISGDSWRRLPRNQKFSYGRGPYNGASIEYDGGTSLYGTTGLGLSDLWKYSISTTNYAAEGTYESEAISLDYVDSDITLTVDDDVPANTSITYEAKTSDDGMEWSDYDEISITDDAGTITPEYHKYIKIKITLGSQGASRISTPTVFSYNIAYTSKEDRPTNPTNINASSASSEGTALTSGNSYPYFHPHFLWSGASSNGSGIAGYYVCFDTDENCDDPETDGSYQTGNTYTVNAALKTGTYHLKIKSKDNNGNIAESVWDAFTYVYNGVSVPSEDDPLHVNKTTEEDFDGGDLAGVDVYDNGGVGSMRLNSTPGFWNQNRLSVALGAINNGGELTLGSCRVTGLDELNDNHCLYTFAGNNSTTFYRYEIETDTWTTMATTPMNTNAGAFLVNGPDNTLYATRGAGNGVPTNSKAFWSYNIVTNIWTVLANAPKDFTYGSSMAYDGSRYIFINPGNEDSFYRYDTQTGDWAGKLNINFGNPNTSNGQFTYIGSDAVYVENDEGSDYVYVVQGNQFPYFARYQVDCNDGSDGTCAGEKNTWTPMAQSPIGFYFSGNITYDSETNAIYAIAGNYANNDARYNARQYFVKYDIETNTWSNLPDAPAVATGHGGSLVNYDGYIYFTRGGGSTNFYRFNIEENSWELPNSGFFGPHIPTGNITGVNSYFGYGNGTYVSAGDGENIYITRGTYDNTFGKYNVATGTFTELARLPVGAYTGSSLVYDNNEGIIYYVPGAVSTARTSANNYFFKYTIATNSWSEIVTATRPSAQVGNGSSMAYDGSRYIYLTQGNGGTNWWRYDTCRGQGICTPSWSANLNNPASSGWAQEAGAQIVYKNGIMYSTRGGGNATNGRYFFSCDVQNTTLPGNCWTRSAGTDLPTGVLANSGGSLIDGNDGYLYTVVGYNATTASASFYYRYNIATPGWEQMASIPAQPTTGGSGTYQSNRVWSTVGAGTNSYNDGLYNYVISSSANGTGFEKTGSYTSETIDLLSVYDWANLTAKYTIPDTSATFVSIQTQTSTGLNGEGESGDDEENWIWSEWSDVSNDHQVGDTHTFTINSPAAEYIKIKINFTSSDQILSPRVDEVSVYYYQDIEAPNNPTSSTAYSKAGVGQVEISNPSGDAWFNYVQPYFTWPAAGEAGGASDNPNPGGSGIAGYYVCFGEGEDCDDAFGDGTFQTDNSFTAPLLAASSNDYTNSGKTYNLLVKAIDNANLIDDESYQVFVYKFDNRLPTNPSDITVNPLSFTAIDNFEFTWENDAADPTVGSGIDRLEYQTGDEDQYDPAAWHSLDASDVALTLPLYEGETLIHAGAYQARNVFRLRVVDKAGNYSVPITQDFLFSATAPTPPQTLRVDPEGISTSNSFTFFWERPASFTGDPAKIKYYYSIGDPPDEYNTVETSATVAGPGPFATKRGVNRFFVVAQDETGNIDYSMYAMVEFTAETSAPGAPLNVLSFDTSNRETEEYSAAIKWAAPTSYDPENFAGYAIFRSDDNENFEEVATTTGTAFIDVNLESRLYYYYVKSKDRTNNYSIASSTTSVTPTGRYTTPPTIVSEPKVTVQAFEATVSWSTNRVASSFVEFGKVMALGETNGQVDSVTDHTVELKGLSAGTKYYYRAKHIDPDGNIGMSEIANFETLPPPTISEVSITDIQLNTAYVSWETNTSATCTLEYGGGGSNMSVEESSGGTSHVQKIDKLVPASTYTAQISCVDEDLNTFDSDEYSFSTPEEPRVSEITVQNKENVDLPTVVVQYKTNVPTTTYITFKGSGEGSPQTYLTNERVTEHTAEIEGLDPAVEYTLNISGIDEHNIQAKPIEQKITTRTDSRPPKIITNRAVGRVLGRGKTAQANLYIKIETDEVTRVKVGYAKGITTKSFEQTASDDNLNTYHLITIPSESGQVYSFQIEAYDEANNKTLSEPTTLAIDQARANATEVVTGTFLNQFGWIEKLLNR